MPLLWVMIAILLSVASLSSSEKTTQSGDVLVSETKAISGSILLYRNYIARYVELNPTFVGEIPEDFLSLPVWYVKPYGLSNYVMIGVIYVFYEQPLPGLVGELTRRTESINVGANRNGYLVSPSNPNSGLALPAQIPNGSVVLMQ